MFLEWALEERRHGTMMQHMIGIGRRRTHDLFAHLHAAYHDLVWRLVEVGNAMSAAVATHSLEEQDVSGYICSEPRRRMSSVFLPLLQLLLGEFIQDGRR